MSYNLLTKRLIKYNDFLILFEKCLIKSIENNSYNNDINNISSIYEIMEYDIETLKLILENKINFKNSKELLKDKLNEKQLKAIEPIINKIKLFSFNSKIKNISDYGNNTICIEYYFSKLNSVSIIKNSDNNKEIYGKQAKFITEDIKYDSLISIFSDNKKAYDFNILFLIKENIEKFGGLKVKAIYLPNNCDEFDIKLIKCILNNDDIKLYKAVKENGSVKYLLI
ncbi:hypothetical protein [uncultured Brachyspira sp.]|uniref:hypothetical protein n=1 Tax=uncultured Brachyspira sp. TaxID=221953 RepID=UPI00338F45DD